MTQTIVFGPNPSISRWIYKDIIDNPESEYCDFRYSGKSIIGRILFSRKFQEVLPHFAQRHLYRKLLGYDFLKSKSSGEQTTFLFTCQYAMFFMTCFWPFLAYLKREYPNAKFAFYYYDIIYTCCPELVDRIKEQFPKILTFDPGDAQKYGIEYYGEICSHITPDGDSDIQPFDIFYAGGDRGRFDIIMDSFRIMSDRGMRCVFYVIDIEQKNFAKLCDFFRISTFDPQSGAILHYKDSTMYCNIYCPYPKALNYIEKSKGLFEVVFPGQTSGSMRLPQASIYHKKLITNCNWVKNRLFYSPQNISIFSTPEEIDLTILNTPYKPTKVDFSPIALVDHINRTYIQK